MTSEAWVVVEGCQGLEGKALVEGEGQDKRGRNGVDVEV